MALVDYQAQIRDLVMGPGTDYEILSDFDPFTRTVRAEQGGPRAWNHGSWSGAEWTEQAIVAMRLRVRNLSDRSPAGWLAAHRKLLAAFASSHDDLELRFMVGGVEYVMFGRPRLVEPAMATAPRGWTVTRCAFVALDPLIYSGVEHSTNAVALPTQAGGLGVPFGAPFGVGGTVVGGRATLTNAGTADAGMLLRLDGPLPQPTVTLQLSSGDPVTLRILMDLPTGQWLDVDTAARTAFLNGLQSASRRGQVSGDWPLLPPGTSTLRFSADDFDEGTLTVTFRDAWW